MPELSVIIPIYNVEKYLKRCVSSVTSQDYKDLEVILVDDGSPDSCPAICDELAMQDDRIRVIHKPNGGLSSARNAGLEIACGEYVAFLDSDDAWMQNKLSRIMQILFEKNPDLLMFMSYDITHDGKMYERRDMHDFLSGDEIQDYSIGEYYKHLIADGNLHESACTKILPREFILKNELFFQKGIISEDTEWMFRVLRCVKRITVTSTPLFVCTVDRVGSISNSANAKSIDGLLTIIEQSIINHRDNPSDITEYELMHCAYLLSIAYGIYPELNKDDKKKYKKHLKELSHLFAYNQGKKVRLVRRVYKLFGFSACTSILGCYIRINRKVKLGRKENDEQKITSSSISS